MSHLSEMLAGNCHVAWSDVRVIRYVRSRMDKRVRKNTEPGIRMARKGIYRAVLKAHHRNQKMFDDIARGNIG